ncbi:hypothetical protein [Streptomyces sp. ms184]|uniref:hypothetical protein n=1 Tax=Streptomyces sp. ms184 TaxID=1827974 RepID=UPI0015CF6B72|nr:hypothetical protein [Streptomyces sp. ms184]
MGARVRHYWRASDISGSWKARRVQGGQEAVLAGFEGGPGGDLAGGPAGVRPVLEQTARARGTTSCSVIRKRLPALPWLHRDDESVVL